jgi:hypothetical protein
MTTEEIIETLEIQLQAARDEEVRAKHRLTWATEVRKARETRLEKFKASCSVD